MKTPKKSRSPVAARPRPSDLPAVTTPPLERVVWALDPFGEDSAAEVRTGRVLGGFSVPTVQPVYLVPSPEDAVLVTPPVDARSPWGQRTLAKMVEIAKKAKIRSDTPKLLTQPGNSMQLAVIELVNFAKAEKASAIAVGTHSRKGAARFFLGSFAETLLLSSPLPVLVANPRVTHPRPAKRVLFPTDFSDASREAFAWVRSLAKQLDAELHLFHRNLLDRDPARVAYEPPAVPEALWLRLQEGRLTTGRLWLAEARAAGLRAELHVSRSRRSVAEAVAATAKRLAPCMVVLASHGNALATKLLGSVARQLVRGAPCPVLVIPPKR